MSIFYPFLQTVNLVLKIFKKKNFTLIKSSKLNNCRFFTNEYTHLLRTSYFWPKGLQIVALQQRYSPFQSENPISREKLKITSTKIQILPQIFFHKPMELFGFWRYFMKKQLKLIFPKTCVFNLERSQTSKHCFRLNIWKNKITNSWAQVYSRSITNQ